MRCLCCNVRLNEYEATLRSTNTGEFMDLCLRCLDGSGVGDFVDGCGYVEDYPEDDEDGNEREV